MTRNNEEDRLQIVVADYLRFALPPDAVFYAVPNGGKRSKATAGLLKRMGVRAGVPDLAFIVRGKPFFIELKTAKGTKTESQKQMFPILRAAGAETFICRSLEDVERVLRSQGIEPDGRCG